MVAMVGGCFHRSAVLSSPDCHPLFHSLNNFHPAPSCRSEDGASSLIRAPVSKSRLDIGFRRHDAQCSRTRCSKEAWVHEISLGIRIPGQTFAVAGGAHSSAIRKAEFKARAVGNGELDCNSDAGDTILIRYRTGEDGSGSTGAKDGETKPRLSGEGGNGDGIAEAAKAATQSEKLSTEEFVEKFEESTGMDWKSSKPGNPKFPEDDCSGLQDERFLRRVALAENADAALALIAGSGTERGGFVSIDDCSQLILAALAQNNAPLAFSILNSMRSSLLQRRIDRQEDANEGGSIWGWRWPQPRVTTYVAFVQGLAASLRVSDAIQTVADVRRGGVPEGDEVPFGKVVKCPTCKTSLAVVQPQHGVQLVPCSTCRYQYELMSGAIVSSESESISSNSSFWERALQVLPFLNRRIPGAVHSIVVQAPDGLAQTHRFATESADVPGQQGERVTMVLASPAKVGRGVGPIRFNARAPGWRAREPMAVTNHITGQVLSLLRAPPQAGSRAALDTSVIVPVAILLASTDLASGLIDPSLPRLVAVGAAAALTLGGAANTFLLPQLNQLPQRTVDAIAFRQRLLAQYEQLQARLQELSEVTSDEVRMLARMCQLQNKMEAVGEASYGARIERVRKARDGLDERLAARLELLDSYAKVASMIEIEVEMDIDVLAAEAASPEASIAEQIERLMEVESLQKAWKTQAEANDEVERLLRSSPLVPDSA